MKKYGLWILLAAGAAAWFFLKKRGAGSATSSTAKALTAATTTGTSRRPDVKGADSSGQGFGGWLAYGQNVLKNTTDTINKNQDDTAAIRNLGGTFARLWSGGGGAVSAQTSGGGAGVPIDYESPGPNVRANQTGSGDDVNMDLSYDPDLETGVDVSQDFGSYDEGWEF
jgi:hypothetical protein